MSVPVEGGFEGGHGSHWDAVLEDPGELPRVVAQIYKSGTATGPLAQSVNDMGPSQVRVLALALGGGPLEARLIEVRPDGKQKPGVATVYPCLAQAGPPVDAQPTRILEWGHGAFEAEVFVRLGAEGGDLAFFATDFQERRARYRGGEPCRVALSAIAYTAGMISPKQRLEAFGGTHVDVAKASIVAPLKDSEKAPYYDDDFFLQGPVTACVPFGYPPWGEGAVLRLALEGLGETPVFVRKKDFPNGWPKGGEFVAAYCWLQGHIA